MKWNLHSILLVSIVMKWNVSSTIQRKQKDYYYKAKDLCSLIQRNFFVNNYIIRMFKKQLKHFSTYICRSELIYFELIKKNIQLI